MIAMDILKLTTYLLFVFQNEIQLLYVNSKKASTTSTCGGGGRNC